MYYLENVNEDYDYYVIFIVGTIFLIRNFVII